MNNPRILKLVDSSKQDMEQSDRYNDPLFRFKKIVLNLDENALECLNRISRQEMEKESPSPDLMEEYYLLHHYLDFIKRLCNGEV